MYNVHCTLYIYSSIRISKPSVSATSEFVTEFRHSAQIYIHSICIVEKCLRRNREFSDNYLETSVFKAPVYVFNNNNNNI